MIPEIQVTSRSEEQQTEIKPQKEKIRISMPDNWWCTITTYDTSLTKPVSKILPLSQDSALNTDNLNLPESSAQNIEDQQISKKSIEMPDIKVVKKRSEVLLLFAALITSGLIIWLISILLSSIHLKGN